VAVGYTARHNLPPSGSGQLRLTDVLIFGSPQSGTPFMDWSQTVGIDQPQKALVSED